MASRSIGRAGRLVGLGLAIALVAGAGGDRELTRFEFRETHMGSEFKILLYSPDAATARRASRAAFDRVARLDAALSDYDPESELSRLSDKAGGPPVPVSADLFRILERSKELADRSGGAFDPTIGPVVKLWRRARRQKKLPDAVALEAARAKVDHRRLRLDRERRTAQLLKPGMRLDLGGIAKGFAAGEAIAALKKEGIDRALVAAEGDIVVSGPPPGAAGWTIAIAGPEAREAKPSRWLMLHDRAISTSGDLERFVEIGGVRYSHIVDPKTGAGIVDRASVTVVAPDGATADATATAASVLGPERGLALVDATEGAAGLYVRAGDEDGRRRVFESRRFADLHATDQPGE
ncbi:MAG TPA: FAD:protein FMN transferase [Isosphaeraceae bacterium]|jgi:thiamine biosynthesis lipoprotein|nr:FAD:protein FMN transferase [Isosphaeraceae bacterium]